MPLDVPAPVVEAVDAQDLELRRERVDLAQEVLRGEPPLAERVRRRVGCRGDARPGRDELRQQARHEPGVARVVQLELVDRDEGRTLEQLHRVRVPDRADERGVLDERAEVLAAGREVPERREQVGLADAEAAVEVDARLGLGRLAGEQPLPAGPRAGEVADRGHRRALRREVAVGVVRVEGRVRELARRHEVLDDLGTAEGGHPVDDGCGGHAAS